MRTKLISLLLCFAAVVTLSFTGCGEKEDEDIANEQQASARTAVSVNMLVVSENKVDDATAQAVEDAFNSITKSKFTTRVDLEFYTADEYYDMLDARLENAATIKAENSVSLMPMLPGISDMEGEETAETTIIEEFETNELGQTILKYPEIEEGQVDIIFLSGKDLLDRYVTEGKLMSIEEKLNSSDAKVLKDYIYPSAIERVKVNNGGTVAQAYSIPNNNIIGDYTYLLVNKEMAEKYYIDVTEIDSFADCADLIADIGKNEKGIAPVLAYANPVNMQYWLDLAKDEGESTFTFAVDSTDANVFGAKRNLPVSPVASGRAVMVPLKFFAEALDARYAWKSAISTATLTYGTRVVNVVVGSATATVNGETVTLSAPVYLDETTGEVMAPADFVADSLCADFTYDAASKECTISLKDFGGLSLLASYITPDTTFGDFVEMTSAFAIPEFAEHMVLMKKCEENGWFAKDADTADFGVAIKTGAYETMAQYADKYEVKVLSYPTLDYEDVYDSMFAVTSYTTNISRALEILTLIYTDKEAKNVLQYGVEGVHYEFDDEGNFVVISDDYVMDNNKTGNAFLAYTTADVPADVWENAKASNLDSKVYPFLGFETAWASVGANHISNVRKISNDFFDRMADCKNSAELAAFFEDAKLVLAENEAFQTAIGNPPEIDPSEIIPGEEIVEDVTTPFVVYKQWGTTNWSESGKAAFKAFEEAKEAAKAEETAEVTVEVATEE